VIGQLAQTFSPWFVQLVEVMDAEGRHEQTNLFLGKPKERAEGVREKPTTNQVRVEVVPFADACLCSCAIFAQPASRNRFQVVANQSFLLVVEDQENFFRHTYLLECLKEFR